METPSRRAPDDAPAEAPRPPPLALQSLGDGIRLAHAHFATLFPLVLLVDWSFELIVTLATGGGPGALYHALLRVHLEERGAGVDRRLLVAVVVAALDAFLPTLVATAVVARAVRALSRGRPARRMESLGAGVRRIHVAVATAAAFSVIPIAVAWLSYRFVRELVTPRAVAVDALVAAPLTILLGAAIISRFALATPAAVVERRGVIAAWRRSERLVEGSMWRMVGLVLLVGAAWAVLVRGLVDGGTMSLAEELLPAGGDGRPVPPAALALAFGRSALEAWFHLIVGVVATLLFERMRRAKEGPDGDELQQVFA